MSKRSSLLGLLALSALLFGCPPPSADSPIAATLSDDAIVVEAHADIDDVLSWLGRFEIKNAPAGEYTVFSSNTRPTSLAGMADVDLSTCERGGCTVPGLGTFENRVVLDAAAPLGISGSTANPGSTFFVTLVRRGNATTEPLSVGGYVDVEQNSGGCANPEPPSVKTTSLGGAPPRKDAGPASTSDASDADASHPSDVSDAGAEASKAVPSCEDLKAQVDQCENISQDAKDTLLTFCAGVSEACRACLDGTLCGVTEQCDPACGK